MATTAQSPNDLTRQQLDELDDLLQRMLSLPLNPPESFTPAAASTPSFAPPMPPAPREMPQATPAPRAYVPPAAPAAPPPAEPAFAWPPPPAPAPMPAPRPAPAARPAPAPEQAAPFEWAASESARALPIASPAPQSEPVPFLFAPFVAFNALLNGTLGLFGFPGRVLRSGFVKTLFGLAGVGLLVYTGLKVAQLHGLVTLPQELPWPPQDLGWPS
jgi:hypothetical protein